ncbi:MAG: DUF255 domain-containing protein [Pedobacter sp.]|nr:MAG: DUF255 domain-containing protein [Pedobacter sp.]
MKKCIWAVCLLLISLTASAEINFLDNPVWSTVLEKAKKENKMIFLDGYATWCGPCKQMDAETYKDAAVSDYYNANFINVKYDLEKGEGPMLAERYLVNAYPNLLFINTDGVLLHKSVGFSEAADFLKLGNTAKDPNSQYYTLKKNALSLTNAQFLKFAEMATDSKDEDADLLINDYLAKQANMLGNDDLIALVMLYASALPDEKSLNYFKASKDLILKSGKFTVGDFEERLVALTIGYALSENVQADQEKMDFDEMSKIFEKFIPEKSFFVLNYLKVQFAVNQEKIDDAITGLDLVLSNIPAKVTFDQACNLMINLGPVLLEKGKLDASLKKFEDIKLTGENAKLGYMKTYIKAVIYLRNKDFDKFKVFSNELIANPQTPDSVKEDIKSALQRIAAGN